MKRDNAFSKLISDLQSQLILRLPFTSKAIEIAASLPADDFRIRMLEKLKHFSGDDLRTASQKISTPETRTEREIVAYLTKFKILEEIKHLIQQETFLREHNEKYRNDNTQGSQEI